MELAPPGSSSSKELVSSMKMPNTKDYFHRSDVDDDNSELELGLGLSLGGSCGGVKFLTAQDLPSRLQATSNRPISGSKRAADHQDVSGSSSPPLSQVVGWPPVGAYRMNSLASQTRASNTEDGKMNGEGGNKKMNNGGESKAKAAMVQETPHLGFVKVNMDGVQIGRKLDLNAHSSYESLAHAIEDMFLRPSSASVTSISVEKDQQGKPSKLLDGSSEFVLTYEDKEGDWMLVGDVPFRMFLGTVRRLRIMRTSEANGLAPRSHDRLRSKPI